MRTIRRSLTAGIGALLLAATPAFAAAWTWTGAAGNNSWNNFANWFPVFPSGPPENNGTADIIFGSTPRLTPDLTIPWNVNSVTFNNTAGPYDLISTAGNTLTIGAGGITNNDADGQTISHALTLSAAQTWNAVAGPLTINGAVNNGGNLLTIDGANSTYINVAISGSGGLTKNGLETLRLEPGAADTYAGTTTVNAGVLEFSGQAGGIVVIPGALNIGDGVGTAIDSAINRGSNHISDSATVSVFSTGYWLLNQYSEAITNLSIVSTGIAGGGLVAIGAGTVTILGNLTMTGGTVGTVSTVSTGALLLNGNLTTNATGVTASISSKLDLNNGARTFTIADGVPDKKMKGGCGTAFFLSLNMSSVLDNICP